MLLESYLTLEQKIWLNQKLDISLQKEYDDFNFLDNYIYLVIKDFSTLLIRNKIYVTSNVGMGHILIIKRDDRSEPYHYHFFYTNSRQLPKTHIYIYGYNDVGPILEQIRIKKELKETTHAFFPDLKADTENFLDTDTDTEYCLQTDIDTDTYTENCLQTGIENCLKKDAEYCEL